MKTDLYYRQGSSDKEYHAQIESKGVGWVVNFQYGRRGSTLQAGSKTPQPVTQDEAQKIFDKLVAEKKAKGYTEGEAGTPYVGGTNQERVSGVVPQLLNPIEEHEVEQYIKDPDWYAQEKYDGRNRLLRVNPPKVEGINRKGLVVGLPQPLADFAAKLGPCLLAGEIVGEVLWVFDLLERQTRDLRELPYAVRLGALDEVFDTALQAGRDVIRKVPTAVTTQGKQDLLADLKHRNAEGIVFKRRFAVFTAGRPASGGDQLKAKFYAACSAIVARVNAQRSVGLCLLSERGTATDVGNVSIPPNREIPKVGAVVEIRYLNANPGGSLYQPVYLGPRDDVGWKECSIKQLKFKRDELD